uniref:Putative glutamate receptor 3.3-like n=1 Tax=Davidia involucrata TaxID=16924 RepID=A0A5B7A9D3_DAVIN
MVVFVKPRKSERAWLFGKPFTTNMWVITILVNIYNGFVIWCIEQKDNEYFGGTWFNQIGTTIWITFTTLFSTLPGDRVHSNLSRMVMVVWLFVALVITSSYTASLTSMLTIQRLNPTVIDVETLQKSGAKVGCDGNSFVVKYLEDVLKFDRNNIIEKYTGDAYPEALIRGEIAAAFLEVPYVKVLLAKYCNNFTTSGPTFKVGGFGFVRILLIYPLF